MGTFPASSFTIALVEKFFNGGDFEQALDLSLTAKQILPEVKKDARYWCFLAMCQLRFEHGYKDAIRSLQHARECANWREQMYDSFYRDVVIYCIRFKDETELAESHLSYLMHLNQDKDLANCYLMLSGRLARKRRDVQAAVLIHLKARQQWAAMGDGANDQWVMNNNFHLLVAMVDSRGILARRSPVYHEVLQCVLRDPNKRRQHLATAMHYTGRLPLRFVGY